MKLTLHVGAHKTATTYVQETLALNTALLAEHSIFYLPLNETRTLLTSEIDSPGARASHELQKLKQRGFDTIVLSDENFIGAPQSLLKTGILYPQVKERMKIFVDAFDGIRVYFCIRSYETFWSSYYCEIIRHQPFIDWSEFLTHFSLHETTWTNVVGDLVNTFGEEQITLWDYNDFRSREDDMFSGLITSKLKLEKAGPHVRESPSNKAIKILTSLRDTLTDYEIRKLVWPISKAFPKDSTHGAFRPFTEQMEVRLNNKFLSDLLEIHRRYPQINWL